MTKIEYGIIAAIIVILILIGVGAVQLKDEKRAFVAECGQHEPVYQCEVKWKQMHPDPLVVIAPLNR